MSLRPLLNPSGAAAVQPVAVEGNLQFGATLCSTGQDGAKGWICGLCHGAKGYQCHQTCHEPEAAHPLAEGRLCVMQCIHGLVRT